MPANDKEGVVDVMGFKMCLDHIDSLGIGRNGEYEPRETKIVMNLVQPGWTVVDVGANVGYYTLVMSRAVGEKGMVYAFEPDPENFAILLENIERNGCKNVKAINAALMDRNGTLKFSLNKENSGDHHFNRSGTGDITVRCLKLDSCIGRGVKVSFVKMDIQGAEYFAAKGMRRALMRQGAILMTELDVRLLGRCGVRDVRYLRLLRKYGYSRFMTVRRGRMTKVCDYATLAGPYRMWLKRRACNVFCFKDMA